jgi:hypothetical protein
MVTQEKFVDKVREIAGNDPEHTYRRNEPEPGMGLVCSCLYTNRGEDPTDPYAYGCLFGQALRQLGHPVPEEFEGRDIGMVLNKMFGWATWTGVSRAACDGQNVQDTGGTWGQALEMFERALDPLG